MIIAPYNTIRVSGMTVYLQPHPTRGFFPIAECRSASHANEIAQALMSAIRLKEQERETPALPAL